jgi:hypothetical protein
MTCINYNVEFLCKTYQIITQYFENQEYFTLLSFYKKTHRFDHISFHPQLFHLYLPEVAVLFDVISQTIKFLLNLSIRNSFSYFYF